MNLRKNSKALREPNAILPTGLTFLVLAVYLALVLCRSGGDPRVLVQIGTRYSEGDPLGTEGYDGQFVYYIARDPTPSQVVQYLDVPAYRYQRILLPMVARFSAMGNPEWILWALPIVNFVAHIAGTWMLASLLIGWGVSPWYALIYGLWVGFGLALRLDLPEPLAYALIVGGLLSNQRGLHWPMWVLFGLGLFAKEVTIAFVLAGVLSSLLQRDWRNAMGISLVSLLPFGLFQLWLMKVFGHLGLGSGGAMASGFEVIPFMGFWRIFLYSVVYGLAMLLVFGPTVLLPSVWGILVSIKKILSQDTNMVVLALLLNAIAIVFLPFSTFRETGGLLRFSCGLVTAVVCLAAVDKIYRVLRYGFWWMILNVFWFKG